MTSNRNDDPGGSGLMWGTGASLLAILCCAGPALIAAGALTGIGGFLRSPWVIGAGITLLVVAGLARQRHRRNGDGESCPPTPPAARPDHSTDTEGTGRSAG